MNFNIFRGFRKNEYFLDIKIFLNIFWVVFFKVKVQNGEYFFSCLNLKFKFFGVLEIPDIFLGG